MFHCLMCINEILYIAKQDNIGSLLLANIDKMMSFLSCQDIISDTYIRP